MKKVKAYYSGSTYPGQQTKMDKNRFDVSIQYEDDTWETVFSMNYEDFSGSLATEKKMKAFVILEHAKQRRPSEDEISALVAWPGHDLYRLTPRDIDQFFDEYSPQPTLFQV